MNLFSKISPLWPLRLGLGFMFLYSGYDIFVHPKSWYWAVRPLPQAVQVIINNQIGIDTYLKFQAGGEILLGIIFLAWFLPRWTLILAVLLASLEMALILLFVGIDPVTFRDLGVLGAALALLILTMRRTY